MILSGQKLIEEIHRHGCSMRRRLWVASPYLGEPDVLFSLFGRAWYSKGSKIDVRFLTDISNDGWLNPKTFELLRENAKTLAGLHAKVFVIDNLVIVGSANLTRRAFEKRYELCISLTGHLAKEVVAQFDSWWAEARSVNRAWSPKLASIGFANGEEPQGQRLTVKAKLPDATHEYNCEVQKTDSPGAGWQICSVEKAKSMIASGERIKYRCVECKGKISLHKAWKSGEFMARAHPEHRKRQSGCSLSDAFNGKQRQADDVVL